MSGRDPDVSESLLPNDPIAAIDGMLAHLDADSVELQEKVGRTKYERYRQERDERTDY